MPVTYTWSLVEPPQPTLDELAVLQAELPRDIALDLTTGEIDLSTGGLRLTKGAEAVAQSLYIRLGIFRGECFWDLDAGTPYFENVLVKAPQTELLRTTFRDRILGTQDVTGLNSLTLDYDAGARTLAVGFSVATPFGTILANVAVNP